MNFETKYKLGQRVHVLSVRKNDRKQVKCSLCNGRGEVNITNSERSTYCPDCSRGYIWVEEPCCDFFKYIGVIGKIRIESYSDADCVSESYKGKHTIKYMIDSTGVGTGTVWSEEQVFNTIDELEAEAERIEAEYIFHSL